MKIIQSWKAGIERFWRESITGFSQPSPEILAIDLGTAHTRIYLPGKGVVVNEPSLIALKNEGHQLIGVGEDARKLARRQPRGISIIRPFKDGVVANCEAAGRMLEQFFDRSSAHFNLCRPSVLICTPAEITQLEQKAFEDAARQAGAGKISLIEEPYAVTLGPSLGSSSAHTHMVVDIGAGTTDIAVTCEGSLLHASTQRIGGYEIDCAILRYMHQERTLEISEATAEEIKIELGAVHSQQTPASTMQVRGRNLKTGLPGEITVSDHEIYPLLQPALRIIKQQILTALEDISTGASVDLLDSGISLSGGLSQLKGLPEMLSEELNLIVRPISNPTMAAILGAGRFLEQQSSHTEMKALYQQESPGW